MKVTEKIYIEWLEAMVKKYKEYLCDNCPKEQKDFFVLENSSEVCDICKELARKYTGVGGISDCPCYYFENDEDINMVKVAWKVIRGWKKDHNGGGK